MQLNPQLSAGCHSIDEVYQFVKTIETVYLLDRPITGACDRREHERFSITMPVTLTSAGGNFGTGNVLHHGISRDICRNGMGLVTMNPVRPGQVLLTIEPCRGEVFEILAKITYCNEIGFYYQIGCEFLCSPNS